MKVLITGTGGYVGSIAARLFLKEGFDVVGVDALYRGFREPQERLQQEFGEDRFRFYEEDIATGIQSVFERERDIAAVVHFAALCNVGESEKDPGLYFKNNVGGTIALLDAMKMNDVNKLVFSSTCAAYGEPQYIPIDEDHPNSKCTNAYGESKLMAEKIIQWYERTYDLKYMILRYFNICGASVDGEFGDSKKPSFHLMQNAVRATLGLADFHFNYTEVDTPDGSPIRDYIDVVDLADAHIKALNYLENENTSEIVNLGTGIGNSVLEIVQAVETVMNVKIEKSVGQRRAGDAVRAVANNEKARTLLNWKPTKTLEQSVLALKNWYSEHPNGWKY